MYLVESGAVLTSNIYPSPLTSTPALAVSFHHGSMSHSGLYIALTEQQIIANIFNPDSG